VGKRRNGGGGTVQGDAREIVKFKIPGEGMYEGSVVYDKKLKNEKRDGYGTMNYINGDKYEGEWKNDKRDGQGVMTYVHKRNEIDQNEAGLYGDYGGKYEGEWKNDKKNGHGVMVYDDGMKGYKQKQIYQGQWMDDKRHGEGRMEYRNKPDVYDGNWVDDKEETITPDKILIPNKRIDKIGHLTKMAYGITGYKPL
jgi:hypothetical protein